MSLVSVIIPTYNNGRYVAETVRTVLSQTFTDLEVIVVDDGSTDGTAEELAVFEGRIRYVRQQNGGPAKARNRGISASTGQYLAFCDADDLWLPTKVEKQVDFLNRHADHRMVYSDLLVFDTRPDNVIHPSWLAVKQFDAGGMIVAQLLRECFILTSSVLVRRECLSMVGGFDEELPLRQDYDLWLRIAREFAIGKMDEVLVLKREHDSNIGSDDRLANECLVRVMEKVRAHADGLGEAGRAILRARLAETYFNYGYACFVNEELGRAAEAFRHASRYATSPAKPILYYFACMLPTYLVTSVRKLKALGRRARA